MLDIIPSPDNVGAYKISGKLTGADYDRIVEDVEARLERHRKIGVLVDLTEFKDLTFEAGARDLGYAFSKLPQWGRFAREAIITEKEWLHSLVHLADRLLPFTEVKTFTPGETPTAMWWVADAMETAPAA